MNFRNLFWPHEFQETLNGLLMVKIWMASNSSKNHWFKLYVSQGEYGVMIWSGIKMEFICGTVGELGCVKRNSPSYLWLPGGQLYPIVWFSRKKMRNLSFTWILPLPMLSSGPKRGWKSRGCFCRTHSWSDLEKIRILTP